MSTEVTAPSTVAPPSYLHPSHSSPAMTAAVDQLMQTYSPLQLSPGLFASWPEEEVHSRWSVWAALRRAHKERPL